MARSAVAKLSSLLLTDDVDQQSRLVGCLIGGFIYLIATGVKIYEICTGLVERRELIALLCVLMMLTTPLFYLLIRSGLSRHFRDPSLTMAQMLTGVTITAFSYAISDQQRVLSLLVMEMLMLFGIFNLNRQQVRQALGYTVSLLAITCSVMSLLRPQYYPLKIEVGNFVLSAALLASIAALAGQLARLRGRLKKKARDLEDALQSIREMAIRDELTGAYNRRHMTELLDFFLKRQRRSGTRFAVVMIDLDHFKQVNDTHGHAIGDEVLKNFAACALTTFRESDIVCRWGGEEFLVLLPDTRQSMATICAERLRTALAARPMSASVPALRLSFSGGITESTDRDQLCDLTQRADKALYAAKAAGRDQLIAL